MEKEIKLTKAQQSLKDINKPSLKNMENSSKYDIKLIRSCKNVKMLIKNTSSIDKSLLKDSSKKNAMRPFNTKSVINLNNSPHRLLTESSTSLKPFPKIDPEFYDEKKDYFWQNDIKRIKSEKSIFSNKKTINKTLNESLSKNFHESKVFTQSDVKKNRTILLKSTKNVEVNLDAPLVVTKKQKNISSQRERDFHINVCVTNPNKSIKEEGKANRTKTISPMHLKLYESSMMKNQVTISGAIPKSHPSYNKEPPKNTIPPSTKKRIDTLKTSYNFMKNYH